MSNLPNKNGDVDTISVLFMSENGLKYGLPEFYTIKKATVLVCFQGGFCCFFITKSKKR